MYEAVLLEAEAQETAVWLWEEWVALNLCLHGKATVEMCEIEGLECNETVTTAWSPMFGLYSPDPMNLLDNPPTLAREHLTRDLGIVVDDRVVDNWILVYFSCYGKCRTDDSSLPICFRDHALLHTRKCKFTCTSGKCLYLGSLVCNQQNDCGDNSDEENCLLVTEHPPPGIFNCVRSASVSQGQFSKPELLEYSRLGGWQTVELQDLSIKPGDSPKQAPVTQLVHRHICKQNTHRHKIKIKKEFERIKYLIKINQGGKSLHGKLQNILKRIKLKYFYALALLKSPSKRKRGQKECKSCEIRTKTGIASSGQDATIPVTDQSSYGFSQELVLSSSAQVRRDRLSSSLLSTHPVLSFCFFWETGIPLRPLLCP
ncbi:hypothetical protein STEG23_020650 [Scotinomys teguina]